MQAVILAGGKGSRLYPLTADIPKPMLPLFDRPVLEHCIRHLAKHGVKDVIIATSPLAGEIMDYFGDGSRLGLHVRYLVEDEPLGTAGAVKQIQRSLKGTFLVISGDVVMDFDLSEAVARHWSASAILSILLHTADDPGEFGVVDCDYQGRVRRFAEKPGSRNTIGDTVSTGIYILEPEALSCIPYNTTYDFATQLFPAMLNNREPLRGLSLAGYWCDVGNLIHYRNVHLDALAGRVAIDIPATPIADGVWIGRGVDIHESVQLSSPIYIGSGATVRRNAVVGSHTVIGANALIDECAEISGSVIGANSFVGREMRINDRIIGVGCSVGKGERMYDEELVVQSYESAPRIAAEPAGVEAEAERQAA